jgi:hypothetical protein
MYEAMRLTAAATRVYGKERHALLVQASKIAVTLREPGDPVQRRVYAHAERALEIAIGTLGVCIGCTASGSSLADPRLLLRVKRVVNKADPIGLLRSGAPDDEYHSEIEDIASWLPEPQCRTIAQTHAMVHRVFTTWFGAVVAGPSDGYLKIAKALHALRPRQDVESVRLQITPREIKTVREFMKTRDAWNGDRLRLDLIPEGKKLQQQIDRTMKTQRIMRKKRGP